MGEPAQFCCCSYPAFRIQRDNLHCLVGTLSIRNLHSSRLPSGHAAWVISSSRHFPQDMSVKREALLDQQQNPCAWALASPVNSSHFRRQGCATLRGQ